MDIASLIDSVWHALKDPEISTTLASVSALVGIPGGAYVIYRLVRNRGKDDAAITRETVVELKASTEQQIKLLQETVAVLTQAIGSSPGAAELGAGQDKLQADVRRGIEGAVATVAEQGGARGAQALAEVRRTGDPAAIKRVLTELAEAEAGRRSATARKEAEYWREIGALAYLTDVREAVTAYAKAAELDPDHADGWQRLGEMQRALGDLAAAAGSFSRIVQLENAPGIDPHDILWGHIGLGDCQRDAGDGPAALASYQRAKAIAERLAKADPGNAGWQRDLSVSHNKIGDVLRVQGNLPAALDAFNASLAIAMSLAQADPGNAGWQRDLAISNERIGDMHAIANEVPEAIAAFERALGAYAELLRRNPEDVPSLVYSVVPHRRLGALKGPAAGRAHFQAALDILRPLAAANRLDAMRTAWIPEIEAELTALAAS